MKQKGFISILLLVAIILASMVFVYISINKTKSNQIEEPKLPLEKSLTEINGLVPVTNQKPSGTSVNFEIPKSPLGNNPGGARLLSDDPCLSDSSVDKYTWGIRGVSRAYLISKGYPNSYFDKHFCAIAVSLSDGYARVTYKAVFEPYLAWWQHHFPIVISSTGQPILENNRAVIDTSGKKYIVPDVEIKIIDQLLSPQKVYDLMQVLIGPFNKPISINMGPALGMKKVGLYARATTTNPNSTSCADSLIIGTIDVETGKGEIEYNGACQ